MGHSFRNEFLGNHSKGREMYERLPFDRAETIQRLGTKLFTRIKAEDEQAVIRRFLAQGS